MAEGDGNHIEQATIEIKVLEVEYALIPEAAGIIGDDQFAVVMLNAFIVGDRIVFESAQRDDGECGDENDGGDIIDAEVRGPSYRLAPRQSFLRDSGNALFG